MEDSLWKNWRDMVCLSRLSSANFTWSILKYFLPFRSKAKKLHQRCCFISWRRSLSYRNRSISLLCYSVDWLYDRPPRHERVKYASDYKHWCWIDQIIIFKSRLKLWKLSKIQSTIICFYSVNYSKYMLVACLFCVTACQIFFGIK